MTMRKRPTVVRLAAENLLEQSFEGMAHDLTNFLIRLSKGEKPGE